MDRVLKKRKWGKKRILTIAGVLALILLIGSSYYLTAGKSKLDVDRERITESTVTKGPFQESISVNGVVAPILTIYLDAEEGGTVAAKIAQDGDTLKKGDPILRLTNTDEEIALASQQTAVYNVLTQMQIAETNAVTSSIAKKQFLEDVKTAYLDDLRVYNMDKRLYAQDAIGLQELKVAENAYNYNVSRMALARQDLVNDSIASKQQVEQAKLSYNQMTSSLDLVKQEIADLTVKAPVAGQLTSLDAEIGQSKNKGDHLAQIDVLTGFKVAVDVDDHYVNRIFDGLTGTLDFADTTYKLVIKKVYTQITSGKFTVDMVFVGRVPHDIRKGLTLQIVLALGDETQALLLPRGGFYQTTGGNWIFKESADGKTAYRVDIQLGRQNPDYFEVISGLKAGDKVITSSYDNYGNIQELVLSGSAPSN